MNELKVLVGLDLKVLGLKILLHPLILLEGLLVDQLSLLQALVKGVLLSDQGFPVLDQVKLHILQLVRFFT